MNKKIRRLEIAIGYLEAAKRDMDTSSVTELERMQARLTEMILQLVNIAK